MANWIFSITCTWQCDFKSMLHGSSNNCSSNKIYQIYNYYDWAFILRLVDAYSNIHIQCFATLIAPFIYPTDFFSLASRNIHCISIFALLWMYHYRNIVCYHKYWYSKAGLLLELHNHVYSILWISLRLKKLYEMTTIHM